MNKIAISLIEAPVHIASVIQGESYTEKQYAVVPKGILNGIKSMNCELHTGIDRSFELDIDLEKEESDGNYKLRIDSIIRKIAKEYSWAEEVGLLEWKLSDLMIVDLAIVNGWLDILLGHNET